MIDLLSCLVAAIFLKLVAAAREAGKNKEEDWNETGKLGTETGQLNKDVPVDSFF